jgi:hypothetical protein
MKKHIFFGHHGKKANFWKSWNPQSKKSRIKRNSENFYMIRKSKNQRFIRTFVKNTSPVFLIKSRSRKSAIIIKAITVKVGLISFLKVMLHITIWKMNRKWKRLFETFFQCKNFRVKSQIWDGSYTIISKGMPLCTQKSICFSTWGTITLKWVFSDFNYLLSEMNPFDFMPLTFHI